MSKSNTEIEIRFLEIDTEVFQKKAIELGFVDQGEKLLTEQILYDVPGTWHDSGQLLRVRSDGVNHEMTYKHHHTYAVDGALDITISIDEPKKAVFLLENLGFKLFRTQEKKRHTFKKGECVLDFDTWPGIPTYLEIEGDSEALVREVANSLGLLWENGSFLNARDILEKKYNIPFRNLEVFSFSEQKYRE